MKIVHIISGLDVGGAETMLFKLLSVSSASSGQIEIVSLTGRGVYGKKIEELGFSVYALNMPRGRPSVVGLVRLVRFLRTRKDALVHCWMYHGNLVGGFAAKLAGVKAIIWGVRHSTLDRACSSRTTIWTVKLGALLSKVIPRRIVYCSENASVIHVEMGYDANKTVVIPNGFDLSKLKPCRDARRSFRNELGLHENTIIIGLVARFDPQKDHQTFVKAAAHLAKLGGDAKFILCGDRVDLHNAALCGWIRESNVEGAFLLLGRRDDVSRVTAALDIASCSSSSGEAFPNVLGEAMACGVPCVTTDVGDASYIVGKTGIVVPPRSPEMLAQAWKDLIDCGQASREALGREARIRVETKFELSDVANRYNALYKEIFHTVGPLQNLRPVT